MKKLFILSLFLLVGCQNTGPKQDITRKEESHQESRGINVNLEANGNEKTFSIEGNEADKMVSLVDLCPYDGDQYDPENNPQGYHLTTAAADYVLTIQKDGEEPRVVQLWKDTDKIKIDGYWYFLDEDSKEILNILDGYVK